MSYIHPSAKIHPTAVIGDNVDIYEDVYIGPYCLIGLPAEHKAFWGKEPKGVVISRGCVLTGHCTVDSGTEEKTILQPNVWMLKHSHVGHDAYIGEDTVISVGAIIGGHTIVETDCNIGINASVHQKVHIDFGCMVGGNSFVTKRLETKPYRKYAGVPARDIGENIKP